MPGFITHYFFGKDIYQKLKNDKLKSIIQNNKNAYRLGLQGPDIFFYHIPYLRHNDNRNLGSFLHENCINDFFAASLSTLPHKTSSEQETCLAYITGYICHYYLDVYGHPYVYSRIGYTPNLHHPKGNPYYVKHSVLETEIDRLLLHKRTGKTLTSFPYHHCIYLKTQEAHTISQMLTNTLNKILDDYKSQNQYSKKVHITPRLVKRILTETQLETKFLLDRTNIKKQIISPIENYIFHYPVLSVKIISDHKYPLIDCLNTKKDFWSNPWNTNLTSNQTFTDIYAQALKACTKTLSLLDPTCLFNQTSTSNNLPLFLKLLGNRSYHSGLPVN